VTVPPAYVPSFRPLAGAVVVAFVVVAVVAGAVEVLAVVAGDVGAAVAVVPAVVPAAVVPAVVAAVAAPAVVAAAPVAAEPEVVAPDVSPAADADPPAAADSVEPAIPAALFSSVAEVVGSVPTLGTPIVCPLAVAAVQAAARIPADVATAIAFARMLTRRTFHCGWRWRVSRP
jgi:hypothetical protein